MVPHAHDPEDSQQNVQHQESFIESSSEKEKALETNKTTTCSSDDTPSQPSLLHGSGVVLLLGIDPSKSNRVDKCHCHGNSGNPSVVDNHGGILPASNPLQNVVAASKQKEQWGEHRAHDSCSVDNHSGDESLFARVELLAFDKVDIHSTKNNAHGKESKNNKRLRSSGDQKLEKVQKSLWHISLLSKQSWIFHISAVCSADRTVEEQTQIREEIHYPVAHKRTDNHQGPVSKTDTAIRQGVVEVAEENMVGITRNNHTLLVQKLDGVVHGFAHVVTLIAINVLCIFEVRLICRRKIGSGYLSPVLGTLLHHFLVHGVVVLAFDCKAAHEGSQPVLVAAVTFIRLERFVRFFRQVSWHTEGALVPNHGVARAEDVLFVIDDDVASHS